MDAEQEKQEILNIYGVVVDDLSSKSRDYFYLYMSVKGTGNKEESMSKLVKFVRDNFTKEELIFMSILHLSKKSEFLLENSPEIVELIRKLQENKN